MKRQIRRNVFETNSSSVHSLTLCSQEEWDRWERGELYFDEWKEKFVDPMSVEKEATYYEDDDNKYDKHIFTKPDDFFRYYEDEYYGFDDRYTTPGGETVVAFGYYGNG